MVVNIDINGNDLQQTDVICWWMQSSVITLEKPENQYSLGDALTYITMKAHLTVWLDLMSEGLLEKWISPQHYLQWPNVSVILNAIFQLFCQIVQNLS